MKLFTLEQFKQLLKNGSKGEKGKNHTPVVKLVLPGYQCTWLLTEIDYDLPRLAFGLCDLGFGYTDIGWIDLRKLTTAKGKLGLPVERDANFIGKYPISVYAEASYACDYITENESVLKKYARAKPTVFCPPTYHL
jgi:hypothetical protein